MGLAFLRFRRSLIVTLALAAVAIGSGSAPAFAQDAQSEKTTAEEPDLVDEFFRVLHERRRQEAAEQARREASRRAREAAEQRRREVPRPNRTTSSAAAAAATGIATNANTAAATTPRRAVTPNELARLHGTWVFDGMVDEDHLRIAVILGEDGEYAAGIRRFENGTVAQEARDQGTYKLTSKTIAFFSDGQRIDREYRFDEKGQLWIGFPEWDHEIGFAPLED